MIRKMLRNHVCLAIATVTVLIFGFVATVQAQEEANNTIITSTTNGFSGGVEEYQRLGLDLANSYRARHNSPPLKLNNTLSKAAQTFAEYLIRTNSFTNKLEPGYIKNLYSFKGIEIDSKTAVENAIKSWYESKKQYNWNSPGGTSALAFSALVWKSSTDLGIGVAAAGIKTIVVGAFSPEGNLLGEDGKYFIENVFPGHGQRS